MAYLGWGIYVMKTVDSDPKRHKAAWSAAAHLGGRDLSMWTAAYPSGFQPYRKSHTNLDLWALAGYDKKYIGSYMDSQSTSYNHPNSAIEPRIPGIFQYYSIAEDELQKTFAGQADRAAGRRQRRGGLGEADRQARARQSSQVLSHRDGPHLSGLPNLPRPFVRGRRRRGRKQGWRGARDMVA